MGTSKTNVVIKDAPFEMEDKLIVEALSAFGAVDGGGVRRGKIRGTDIDNGIRYLTLSDAEEVVPCEVTVAGFELRVFCDNNRTRCKYCTGTSHPYYRCPAKPLNKRACFRCLSTSHLVQDCENDITCRFCGRSGHRERECYEKIAPGENEKKERRQQDRQISESAAGSVSSSPCGEPSCSSSERQREGRDKGHEKLPLGNHDVPHCSAQDLRQDPIHTLLLGDSNLNNIDPPTGVHISNFSGARFSDASKLITMAEQERGDFLTPDNVIIHLGTNDVALKKTSASDVMLSCSMAVKAVRRLLPGANIVLSSIPPRKGQGATQLAANEVAKSVNSYAAMMAKDPR